MPKKAGETLWETQGNVRENGRKHVENCLLREFPRHLVTGSQAASFIEGTIHECGESPLFIPAHFSDHFSSEILVQSKMAEALDIGCTWQLSSGSQLYLTTL